jgi:hypothetical protein
LMMLDNGRRDKGLSSGFLSAPTIGEGRVTTLANLNASARMR